MTEENTPREGQPADEQPATEQPTTEQAATEQPASAVRTESWDCAGPAELDLSIDVGRIEIALTDNVPGAASAVEVELRADEHWGGWTSGLSGLLNWLGGATGPGGSIRIGGREINLGSREGAFGGLGGPRLDLGGWAGRDLAAEAVHSAEVTWSEPGRKLLVRSSTVLPQRIVPLALTVRARSGSRLTLRTGAGEITVTGRAGTAAVRTGSGDVKLGAVDGDVELTTGSGRAAVGEVGGRTRAKTGSGGLSFTALDGPAQVSAGSGDLEVGALRADLFAKTGSGDLTVADAEAGQLDLTTGSGDLRIGVHAGVAAQLDLRSGSGTMRSELDVSGSAPTDSPAKLTVHGVTGSGDVLVTRAPSPASAAS